VRASGKFRNSVGHAVTAPIIFAALGIFFSIAGIFAVENKRERDHEKLLSSINTGIWGCHR
jgi:Na+/H+-translocating membrane pyrophosphatase